MTFIMLDNFALILWHNPPLLIATVLTFDELMPFFNAKYAILEFDLSQRIVIFKSI